MKNLLLSPRWLPALVPVLVLTLAAGCAFNPNKKTGSDGNRPDAEPVTFDEPLADSISYEDKDRVDWKFVDLAAGGAMTVNVKWDYRRCDCSLFIFDELGGKVAKMPNKGKKYGEELVLEDLKPGKYFFQFVAKGLDDYSDYFLTVKAGTPDDEFALEGPDGTKSKSLIEATAPPPAKGEAAKDPSGAPPEAAKPKVEGVKPSSPPPAD